MCLRKSVYGPRRVSGFHLFQVMEQRAKLASCLAQVLARSDSGRGQATAGQTAVHRGFQHDGALIKASKRIFVGGYYQDYNLFDLEQTEITPACVCAVS